MTRTHKQLITAAALSFLKLTDDSAKYLVVSQSKSSHVVPFGMKGH